MLTAAQIEARRGRLTASRVAALMAGDAEEIMRLWLEMTDQQPEEDLSGNWPAALGSWTEQLNLDWYERKHRQAITRRGEVVIHPVTKWAACTLDGWIAELGFPIECKQVGGREPIDTIVDRYQPQIHWQMTITRSAQCALSIISGADEPVIEWVKYEVDYARELWARADQFMTHVHKRTPPVILPPVIPPGERIKSYDMTGNNLWSSFAADFIEHEPSAKKFETAKTGIKEMMPADAKVVSGHGVKATIDRAGRRHVRKSDPK